MERETTRERWYREERRAEFIKDQLVVLRGAVEALERQFLVTGTPITDCFISTRGLNILSQLGCQTWEDYDSIPKDQLKQMRGVGDVTIKSIERGRKFQLEEADKQGD